MAKPWSFRLDVAGALPAGADPVGVKDVDWAYGFAKAVVNGDTTGKANYVSVTEHTIASGATTNLDVTAWASGGGVEFGDGLTVNFSEVAAFVVVAAPTNTTSVTVQKNGTNGWTGPVGSGSKALAAGDILAVVSKMSVSSTNKAIDLVNGSGASAKVKILIVGIS